MRGGENMKKKFEVTATDGTKFECSVQNTVKSTKKMAPFLISEWCKCENSEFLCYPEDGCCSCGVYKHHVHCKNCGGISQVG